MLYVSLYLSLSLPLSISLFGSVPEVAPQSGDHKLVLQRSSNRPEAVDAIKSDDLSSVGLVSHVVAMRRMAEIDGRLAYNLCSLMSLGEHHVKNCWISQL